MYTSESPIGAGDRAPDFSLPDRAGALVNLYTRIRGGMPIVVFYPDRVSFCDDATALQLAVERSDAGFVDVFAVVRASHEDLPEVSDVGRSLLVVADSQGQIAESYGLAVVNDPLALRFDANLRLTALRVGGADAVAHFVERYREQSADAEPSRLVSSPAPVLIVPHVLSSEFCQELIDLHHSGGNHPSTVTYNEADGDVRVVHEQQKSRFDHVVNDVTMVRRLTEAFGRRLNFEIHKAFNYPVAAHDGFVITRYDAETNGHFSLHRDNVSPTTAHFRFAVTVNLNFGEYEGGQLRFPEYSRDSYAPPTGGAIVFSCSNLHEATPVTSGSRYALLTFLFGADEAQQIRQARS